MKDNELRAIVLEKFYAKRREGMIQLQAEDFADVKEDLAWEDIHRVCDQLGDYGLINWQAAKGRGGMTVAGYGEIKGPGVDVIEGSATPPISMNFDHSVTIHGSSNIQVGNNNTQDITITIGRLTEEIDRATAPEAEKAEAKSRLNSLLSHPLVSAIVGGVVSGASS